MMLGEILSILKKMLPLIAIIGLLVLMVIELCWQGRLWWCACGSPSLWSGDIWSSHNSQHFLDPYSFSHFLHGIIFCGLIWMLPKFSFGWSLFLATFLESCWEIFENTQFVIQRYRDATMALGYEGDSIGNSLGDVFCCMLGFIVARKLGFKVSLVLIVLFELGMLLIYRDNLTLNILMLIWPIKAIKTWQTR